MTRKAPQKHYAEKPQHLAAFEAWYASNRNVKTTLEAIQVDGKPCEDTLYLWVKRYGWIGRADDRDREAQELVRKEAIQKKAEMLRRHAQYGELMTSRGAEFFANTEIKTAADAARAIVSGVEIERKSSGLPTWIFEIADAPDDELLRMYDEVLRSEAESGNRGGTEATGDTNSPEPKSD